MGAYGRGGQIEEQLAVILMVARRTALSKGANDHEADEVAQATALKLWRKWNTADVRRARSRDSHRWHGYIRSAARNVYYDCIRSHQRRLAREGRAAECHSMRPSSSNGEWAAPPSPSEIEAYLARALIAEEILKLPRQQRAAAIRVFIKEMTIAEVAEELGIQAQSVRKNLRAAKETLQARLAEAERQAL